MSGVARIRAFGRVGDTGPELACGRGRGGGGRGIIPVSDSAATFVCDEVDRADGDGGV